VSPLRDIFVAPAPGDDAPPLAADRARRSRPWRGPSESRARATTRSLGVLATARDLPAVACAAGLVVARGAPAALVCLRLAGDAVAPPAVRAPTTRVAARLRASLSARGLGAEARGRLVLITLTGDHSEASTAAHRALAAAGELPTVMAAAVRDEATDALLAAHDAIVVAVPSSATASLAELALAGASELAPSAATLQLALDPFQRALALAGLHAPRTLRDVVEGVLT
jgi:hypothetical protein